MLQLLQDFFSVFILKMKSEVEELENSSSLLLTMEVKKIFDR